MKGNVYEVNSVRSSVCSYLCNATCVRAGEEAVNRLGQTLQIVGGYIQGPTITQDPNHTSWKGCKAQRDTASSPF